MPPLSLVTWNVNSIRARHDRVLALLDPHEPDIVCLQDTNVDAHTYPADDIRPPGYPVA
mgnify:CR=1 FL=1